MDVPLRCCANRCDLKDYFTPENVIHTMQLNRGRGHSFIQVRIGWSESCAFAEVQRVDVGWSHTFSKIPFDCMFVRARHIKADFGLFLNEHCVPISHCDSQGLTSKAFQRKETIHFDIFFKIANQRIFSRRQSCRDITSRLKCKRCSPCKTPLTHVFNLAISFYFQYYRWVDECCMQLRCILEFVTHTL